MSYLSYEKKILKEIEKVLEKNDETSERKLVERIIEAERVFVAGSGRSGLVGKMFAMRLMQLGLEVFAVGETITPSVTRNDLIIAISGSGKTQTIFDVIQEGKKLGTGIISITADKKSKIANKSDFIVILKGKTKSRGKSVQPLGSLFEQSALIFLDAVVIGLVKKLKISEKKMKKNHASLE
jgi:6-phospho-3-hexuloisomerase